MVHIYYHIYAINGVDLIINEQLGLLKQYFNFEYNLNIGLSIGINNKSFYDVFKDIKQNVRDVRAFGNEFTTLDLIEKDKESFGNSDYILYLHTKGVTHINDSYYKNIIEWRNLMEYFLIKKNKHVFELFEKTDYNTYGVNLTTPTNVNKYAYFGNFWWAKSKYIKTINLSEVDKTNRIQSEFNYIQCGENWKPYSVHNSGVNHYYEPYPKEKYEK